MRRPVVDASVWVSNAGYPGSVSYLAVEAARLGLVRSVISEAIVDQVTRTLPGPRLSFAPSLVQATEVEMRRISDLVHPTILRAVISAKESDNRILECAVAGRADVSVTGDRKHLLRLGSYQGITILLPADSLTTL